MWRFAKIRALALGVLLCAAPRPARATYSIVAADTRTREVGGSGTSCLSGTDVYIIYGSVPGVGVVHTQATYSSEVHARSIELVAAGLTPLEVITALSEDPEDSKAELRQFAAVDVFGATAGFTGSGARAFAGDRQGASGTFHYSAQGNILTSATVLSQAAAAFEAPGCDLAERLMRALEAGAENAEGDSRCTPSRGIPSDSAFVQVDRPDEPAGSYLELHVPTSGAENPLPLLRADFDAWRATHPCPAAEPPVAPRPSAASEPADSQGSCACGVSAGPARGSLALWAALAVLLLGGLRRWNPRRFQC